MEARKSVAMEIMLGSALQKTSSNPPFLNRIWLLLKKCLLDRAITTGLKPQLEGRFFFINATNERSMCSDELVTSICLLRQTSCEFELTIPQVLFLFNANWHSIHCSSSMWCIHMAEFTFSCIIGDTQLKYCFWIWKGIVLMFECDQSIYATIPTLFYLVLFQVSTWVQSKDLRVVVTNVLQIPYQ